MVLAAAGRNPPNDRGAAACVRMICLLAAVAATTAGCASPLYRVHSELSPRREAIRNTGLLSPDIAMYEEQYRFKLIPHEEWSRAAADAVRKAFLEEMTSAGLPVTEIDSEDRELKEMAELFGAVDFSIGRHVYEDAWKETFPEKVRHFDYSLGPAAETLERHRVDAVWIVAGINLLPTVGTRIADTIEALMAFAGGIGPTAMMKLEIRAALVDKSGTVLFYCKLGQWDVRRAAQEADRVDPPKIEGGPGPEDDGGPIPEDIRDPRIARRYVKALISEFRKATEP